jgi:CHAD domain-containing protein
MKSAKPSAIASGSVMPDSKRAIDLCALLVQSLDDRWQSYRATLKRCQKKYSAAAVHDLRVATRRLISMLDLLRTLKPDGGLRQARRRLKKHLELFGPLRDVQVQLLTVEEMLPSFPELQGFYDRLVKRERQLVKRLSAQVKGVKTRKVAKAMRAIAKQLPALLTTPAMQQEKCATAIAAVNVAFGRVVERRHAIDSADMTTIHRMRVAFKKFRYMVEILAPVLEHVTTKRLKALNAFQDSMGHIQDIDVLLASMQAFWRKQQTPDASGSGAHQELIHRRAALIEAFLQSANTLFTFWKPGPEAFTAAKSSIDRNAAR